MTKLSDFGKFLGKYAGEASAVATAFRHILPSLGLGADGREQVEATIDRLENAAKAVAKAAPAFKETTVTVRKSDVEAAVAAVLPGIVAAELARLGIKEAGDITAGNAKGAGNG